MPRTAKKEVKEKKPPQEQGSGSAPENKKEVEVYARHWQRPDVIACDKDPRFKYRLVEQDRVRYWMSQGFVIDRDQSLLSPETQSMESGASHYRRLVLMKCLKTVAEQREQHFIQIQKNNMRSALHGVQVTTAAARVNTEVPTEDSHGQNYTGAFGSVIAKDVVVDEQGRTFSKTKSYNPQNMSPTEAARLSKLRKAQDGEVATG